MLRTITSGMISVIDTTDQRRIDVYISSNMPQVQIKDSNSGTFSPDYTSAPLTLQATVYLDSQDVSSSATYIWYRKYGNGTETQISTNKNLTINTNLTDNSGIVTYRCVSTYQGLTDTKSIIFNRSDTGQKGSDGTSVSILGVAYTTSSMVIDTYYTLYSDSTHTTLVNTSGMNNGDSYLVDGYLCVYNTTQTQFLCVGKIQGPPGENGSDAKQIILNATSQVFKVNKQNAITPSIITVTGTPINTSISNWMYSIDGGTTFLSTPPNGVTRNGNIVSITGSNITVSTIVIKATDGEYFDTLTIFKVSDGGNGQPGSPGTPASLAFLTNEHINFVANQNGQVEGQTVLTNIVAYTGTTKVTPVLGTITGLPTGMTITAANITTASNEKIIPIVITANANFGSASSNSGVINIPITSPVSTNLKLNWSKVNTGAKGENAVSFQIYAPNGYLLSSDLTSLTLQTFAYEGATVINSGATYSWYKWVNNSWNAISGETNSSFVVTQSDVLESQTYKCDMTYNGKTYSATETVEDKGDVYEAILCTMNSDVISSDARFIIAYVIAYNNNGEADALLGPISTIAPSNPVNNDYWYSIDETLETVTLKKYNGTSWVDSTDEQEFIYDWNIGGVGKVKIIKKSDISIATNVQCDVVSDELGIVARCNQLLYDKNDPIISNNEPTIKVDGQIWIKTYDNGTFSMYTWSDANNKWITNESDGRQKIFTSKPNNYQIGDLWFVGTDYIPNGFEEGTLLKAKDANLTYSDSNWVDNTTYTKQLSKLKQSVDKYDQFFDFTTENGLQIRAKDANNNPSKFYTQLTNSELGFYQDNDKVAYINNHKMNITEADINIVQTPLLKIGNFSFILESNGSMSIVMNN